MTTSTIETCVDEILAEARRQTAVAEAILYLLETR